ncbi:MAG TPA: ammonium transporter [Caulobacterales bacterium]|nr:ammonium transporter [Caulobacterales bacterium]
MSNLKPNAAWAALVLVLTPSIAWAQPAQANGADAAWVLTASALVLFMTLPGLALFYGGLVRQKNVLSVMMHCIAIACAASLLWLALGYSLAFDGAAPLLGGLGKAFFPAALRDSVVGAVPEPIFFVFQMTFAIITPALIVGAYVERVHFPAVLLFSGLWLLAVYAPVAHWIWGGGALAHIGVVDFAGGLVVHATAGASALVLAKLVGGRDGFPHELHPPHNPGLTMIGAGMLWVGWYGFNGGSALAANADAGMAVLVTHMSACAAGATWSALEWARFGKPSMIGAVTGVVAGLATITPASGFVGAPGALALGIIGSMICFHAVPLVKHAWRIDDSLDVFAVHGVGGVTGSILVAVFMSPSFGGKGYAAGMTMLSQLGVQLLGAVVVLVWSALVSVVLAYAVRAAVGLRAREDHIREGLDLSAHGERAAPD